MIIFENALHWILRFKYYILDSLATFSFPFKSSSLLSCYLFNLLCLEEEVEKKKKRISEGMDRRAMGLPRLLLGFPIKMQSVICSDD